MEIFVLKKDNPFAQGNTYAKIFERRPGKISGNLWVNYYISTDLQRTKDATEPNNSMEYSTFKDIYTEYEGA